MSLEVTLELLGASGTQLKPMPPLLQSSLAKGYLLQTAKQRKEGSSPRQPSSALNAARGAEFLHALDELLHYLHCNTFMNALNM